MARAEEKREGGSSRSSQLTCGNVTAIARDWGADGAGSHFQLQWKVARRDGKGVGRPVHSRAVTPRGVRLAPELQAAPVLAPYVGALLLFSLDRAQARHQLPLWVFSFSHPPSASVSVLLRISLPRQQPLPSSALVPLSPPGHDLPRAPIAPAPHSRDKSCRAHPELLPHQHGSKLSPRDRCCRRVRGRTLSSLQGTAPPSPSPSSGSPSLCPTSTGRLQPAKADSLAENILDHGRLLPTGHFFPYLRNPNFLTRGLLRRRE